MVTHAEAIADSISVWRRQFHQFPELSFQEKKTGEYVATILNNIPGIEVQTEVAGHGVVGRFSTGEGPTIALRADIDALPIQEENEHAYASSNTGVMHACGHDAHTAILLGAVHLITDELRKGEWSGTILFMFQPAEEEIDDSGRSGAVYMIEEGVLENVDAVLALHMCPWLPVGEIQVNDGPSMASVDVFKGTIEGTGGHGAYPHFGTDPIWMMSKVLDTLYGIVNRRISALDPAVISVGKIEAGHASNIIPNKVTIEGTIRAYKEQTRDTLHKHVRDAFTLADQLGGKGECRVIRGEPALYNDPDMNKRLIQTVHSLYPEMKINHAPFGMGGEDFAYMTKKAAGTMFFLGCALPDGLVRDLHTPNFDINEDCLAIGAAILAEFAIQYVQKEGIR
ncbi:M20 metallopeptidase family protein [Alkalicoccobacillus plakortidis]|uniref:M20 family metallopeptidase n=1 Tax=Alkalicoccobacillus plakortidis TaxID=444060 RepID=A0ABT0XID5_9BACI|nr:M20 family metallopeptidase [Alkalicoccobacillus plakortidis]MCM2675649.1 M20 family metallopeptidase [Alkalicoccobacillus plakortidis]